MTKSTMILVAVVLTLTACGGNEPDRNAFASERFTACSRAYNLVETCTATTTGVTCGWRDEPAETVDVDSKLCTKTTCTTAAAKTSADTDCPTMTWTTCDYACE